VLNDSVLLRLLQKVYGATTKNFEFSFEIDFLGFLDILIYLALFRRCFRILFSFIVGISIHHVIINLIDYRADLCGRYFRYSEQLLFQIRRFLAPSQQFISFRYCLYYFLIYMKQNHGIGFVTAFLLEIFLKLCIQALRIIMVVDSI
jgi:hypothetical protein